MISSVFVQKKYPDISRDSIVELLPNHAQTITVRDETIVYCLRVTAINANHCPGSLMFLMEKLDFAGEVSTRVLYTGDFRFDNLLGKPLTSLQALHSGTVPLHIDEMYLDTTFCSSNYTSFPTRQVAEESIWRICQEWIKKNQKKKRNQPKHLVLFHLPARYGYETMFHKIYQRSGYEWRVHVPCTKFSEYLCSSSLEDCTDPDPANAPYLHACPSLSCQPSGEPLAVITIRPSAMFFTQDRMAELKEASGMVGVSKGKDSYRVCYSTHSSMEELEIFVKHFSPDKITPCAIPPGSSKEEVGRILATFLESSSKDKEMEYYQGCTEKTDSASKICYKDTLDLEDLNVLAEEEINDQDCDKTPVQNVPDLNLELSEDEDISRHNSSASIVIIESDNDCEQDTPEIEDIIEEAEVNDLPGSIIKTMLEYKRRKDKVFVID